MIGQIDPYGARNRRQLVNDLAAVLNAHGVDSTLDMTDYALAVYLVWSLDALDAAHSFDVVRKAEKRSAT